MSAQILTLKLPAPLLPEAVPLAEQLPVGRLIEIARTADGAQMTMAVACLRQVQAQGEPVAWVQRAGGTLFPPDLADSGIDLDGLLIVHVPNTAVSTNGKRAVEHDLAKAAELLLRSGAFGLVVIDLTAVPDNGEGTRPPRPAGKAVRVPRSCDREGHAPFPPRQQSSRGPTHPRGSLRSQREVRSAHSSSESSHGGLELAVQSRLLGLAREHKCSVILLSERGSRSGSLGPLVSLCIEPRRTRVGRGAFALQPHARKDKSGLLCGLATESRRGPWGLP